MAELKDITLRDLRRSGQIIETPKRPDDDPKVRIAKAKREADRRQRFRRRFVPLALVTTLGAGFVGGAVTESKTHFIENIGNPNEGDLVSEQIYLAHIWSSGKIGSTATDSPEITLEELEKQGLNTESMSGFLTYGSPYNVNKRYKESAGGIADMLGLTGEARHFWNFEKDGQRYGLWYSPSSVLGPDEQPYYFELDNTSLSLPPKVETAK